MPPHGEALERGSGRLDARMDTAFELRQALSDAGVIFVDEDGEGPHVRLIKQHSEAAE